MFLGIPCTAEKSMQKIQRVKMCIDISMTLLSVILMGGTMLFPDDKVHQVLGIVLFALWVIHSVFNRRWYSSLLKGKYLPYRIMQVIVNILLLICAFCLFLSGMMMAWFIEIPFSLGLARVMHLLASHWYYIFMCLHLGLHAGMIVSKIKAGGSSARASENGYKEKKIKKIFVRIFVLLFCFYGVYAFIVRGVWKYLFLRQQFFFFDLERGYILFAADYIAILFLIAAISFFLGNCLKKRN